MLSAIRIKTPIRANALVAAVGSYLIFAGVLTLVGWWFHIPALIRTNARLEPLPPNTATAFIAAGAALFFALFERFRAVKVIGFCIAALGIIYIVQYSLGMHWGLDGLVARDFLQNDGGRSLFITPQSAFCLVLTGLGLGALGLQRPGRELSLVTILLGLVCFAVAAIAVYGHAFGADTVYGWATLYRMPPNGAFSFLVLAGALICLGMLSFDLLRASSQEVARAIELLSVAGIIIIAAVSSAFGVVPLYHALQDNAQQELVLALRQSSASLDEALNLYKEIAASFSENPELRQAAIDLSGGRMEQGAYDDLVKRRLDGVVNMHRDLVQAERIVLGPHLITSAGGPPIDRLPKDIPRNVRLSIEPNEPMPEVFRVESPVIASDGSIAALDIFFYRMSSLRPQIQRSLRPEQRRGDIYLAVETDGNVTVFPILGLAGGIRREHQANPQSLEYAARRALSGLTGLVEPDAAVKRQTFTVFSGLRNAPWALLMPIDAASLHAAFDRELLTVMLAVLCNCLLGAYFFYAVVKHLLQHAARLQRRLSLSTESLERELVGRKRAEGLALLHSLANQAIVDNTADGIVTFSESGEIRSFNAAAQRLFGFSDSEILGRDIETILPPLAELNLNGSAAGQTERPSRSALEIDARRRDGETFPAELSVGRMVVNGEKIFTGIVRDITERKRAELEITASLNEKEMLLKEIHHRVKNNLQVISSMFSLQCRRTTEPETQKLLKDSQSRIQTIAILHDALYRSGNLVRINAGDYLHEIARNLTRSYEVENKIKVQVETEEVSLEIDRAIPVGLIVNELMTNSIKHAFPPGFDGHHPRIKIYLGRTSDGDVCLTVSDNGVGTRADSDSKTSKTLGLKLVDTLCQQLRGSCSMHRNGGFEFKVTFQESKNVEKEQHEKAQNINR